MKIGKPSFRLYGQVLLIAGASFVVCAQQQTPTPIASIESLIRARDYGQAMLHLKQALRVAPRDSRLWTLEGIVLSMQGNSHDALGAFDKALHLSPNDAVALKGEAQLLYRANDKRAISLLERIVKADPGDETAHEMIANLEGREGNCEAAIHQFSLSGAAIGSHPGSLETYGKCLAESKQPQKAIDIFQQLANLLPQRVYPKYDLAVLLVETKQYAAAVNLLDPLLAANSSDTDLMSLASQAYEGMGNTPKAVALLRQAIVLSPLNADLYNSFAALCLDHDSFQVGIHMIDAGLERIPNDPSLYVSRGLLYAQLADYDKAEADFKTAERLDSGKNVVSYAMDLAEMQKIQSRGDSPDAEIAAIRSQLKTHPDSALLHYLLANLLLTAGAEKGSPAFTEAMRAALTAVKLRPSLVEAHDALANMYLRSGSYDLAIEQCRQALHYSPTDQSAMYHLITALRHSGESGQRQEMLALIKKLSQLKQSSLQQETDRKRFRLVEAQPAP